MPNEDGLLKLVIRKDSKRPRGRLRMIHTIMMGSYEDMKANALDKQLESFGAEDLTYG